MEDRWIRDGPKRKRLRNLTEHLAHKVYETAPFIPLDSLEAIDSDRISALIEDLEEDVGDLIVALLPEDARELSNRYQRITEI